jgi:phage baseplate assembly protein W
MAYKSLTITPPRKNVPNASKKSQFYRGFSTVDPAKSDTRLYDYDLIKQDILNQFNVRKNERVMNPGYGTIIWDILYEPFTQIVKDAISADVTRIVTSDPRASASQIKIVEQEYGMLLEITLVYNDTDQSDVMKLNFDKSTGLSAG